MILAGDVGATKTTVALFEEGAGPLAPAREATWPTREATSLGALLRRFLRQAGGPRLRAACLGVAGAVADGRVAVTSLPWEVDAAGLAGVLGDVPLRLLNDVEAAGHGLPHLPPGACRTLQAGVPPRGPATLALIAAGTGLGEAIVAWTGERHVVVPSEGGQADFAPRTALDAALWAWLREAHGRVSWEHVLSGPGLVETYRFLRAHRGAPEPDWLAARLAAGDPAPAIAQAGLAGADPVCVEALDLFAGAYGAEAGNLALRALARGGVFLAGGIAPRILPKLEEPSFVAAFAERERVGDLLRGIPVHAVLEPRLALLGAAACARAL